MTLPVEARILSRIFTLVCGVVIVSALYFARSLLLPFALAILLSFLLTPIVNRLEGWRLGRIPSVVVSVAMALAVILVVGYVLAIQFYSLANQLPAHEKTIREKVRAFQSDGQGVLDRVAALFRRVEEELSSEGDNTTTPSSDPGNKQPSATDDGATTEQEFDLTRMVEGMAKEGTAVPVEIIDQLTAREIAQDVLGPVLAPFGTLFIVIVLVIFILLEREDLRNRFIYLVGAKQLRATTEAIDDAAYRVSRYLLMQLMVNSIYGLVIAIGLFFIGLPNALMWGFLATVLRFLPYVGPWIAALLPLVISLAEFPGWTQPLLVLGLFIVNELISNNVFEPWLYGTSTGISTIGIVISAVFWTWLWGPVGLVLATPLTVCLTVIGRHVPQFGFINKLLSDDAVLPAHMRLYQRMLALDPEEAFDVAEEHYKDHSLASLYDTVILPALRLAEQDRHHDRLDESKEQFIVHTIGDMIEEFGSEEESRKTESEDSAKVTASNRSGVSILCVPARDEADGLAGKMLAQLLEHRGIDCHVVGTQNLAGETVEYAREHGSSVVCISAMPPFAATHARYLVKRLRPHFAELKIVVGLWNLEGSAKKSEERLIASGVDHCVTTLSEAVQYLEQLAKSTRSEAKPVPPEESKRSS